MIERRRQKDNDRNSGGTLLRSAARPVERELSIFARSEPDPREQKQARVAPETRVAVILIGA
jgi:hypothetical protein